MDPELGCSPLPTTVWKSLLTCMACFSFSDHDRYCPFWKTVAILRNMVSFYHQARHVCEASSNSEKKVTLAVIKEQMGGLMYEVSSMKFEVRSLNASC